MNFLKMRSTRDLREIQNNQEEKKKKNQELQTANILGCAQNHICVAAQEIS